MKKKKDIVILPKVSYNYKYNVNNTPNINIKKTDGYTPWLARRASDYDSIRDIVEGNGDDKVDVKTNEKLINKFINKFQIV